METQGYHFTKMEKGTKWSGSEIILDLVVMAIIIMALFSIINLSDDTSGAVFYMKIVEKA